MKRPVILLALLLAAAGGGCRHWTVWRGEVVAVLPQHVDKCHGDTAFFVEKTARPAKAAIEAALRERGFEVVDAERECDVVVKTAVNSWEYNDAGFAGPGERDDAELTVTIVDRRRRRVLGRWQVTVRSDWRVLAKCVDEF